MAIPWSPMVPLTMITSPGTRPLSRTTRSATPIPAVLMMMASSAPRSSTLVSPVTRLAPHSSSAASIRCNDPLEIGDIEAFGDDHAAGERDRPAAHHGKVVDGPADGDSPDIPTGEEDRRNNMVIGRKNDVLAVERDDRPVIERLKPDPAGVVVA